MRAPWMIRSPQVQVYELEDVKKRSDESVKLIDRICQLTCCVQIGNGSDAAIEFEVQCRLIQAIPDAGIKLQKELLKVNHEKTVSHLLEISLHVVLLSLEWLQYMPVKPYTPSTKAVNPRKTSHKSSLHSAPTVPVHTLLAVTTALCRIPSAKAVPKKVTGMQSATTLVLLANNPLKLKKLRKPPSLMLWKGKES